MTDYPFNNRCCPAESDQEPTEAQQELSRRLFLAMGGVMIRADAWIGEVLLFQTC